MQKQPLTLILSALTNSYGNKNKIKCTNIGHGHTGKPVSLGAVKGSGSALYGTLQLSQSTIALWIAAILQKKTL